MLMNDVTVDFSALGLVMKDTIMAIFIALVL